MPDDLGDRMKMYEREWSNGPPGTPGPLDPSLPICVRLDGRSFSTFSQGLPKPQDPNLVALMVDTALRVADEANAAVGYTQSDEISLVILPTSDKSDPFFGGRSQKLCSVLAALASVHFNRMLPQYLPTKVDAEPLFDARVWNVPDDVEAANVVLWRELDAFKNGVAALARCHFSAKALHGKGWVDMIAMLTEKGVKLDDQPDHLFYGTFIRRVTVTRKFTTEEIEKLPPKHEARTNPNLQVTRHDITVVDMPPLRLVKNKPEVLFHGEAPVLRPVAEVVAP
jgi:tRNA(His) 5'-end guanylyltransferase